jgi:hypothetical protein
MFQEKPGNPEFETIWWDDDFCGSIHSTFHLQNEIPQKVLTRFLTIKQTLLLKDFEIELRTCPWRRQMMFPTRLQDFYHWHMVAAKNLVWHFVGAHRHLWGMDINEDIKSVESKFVEARRWLFRTWSHCSYVSCVFAQKLAKKCFFKFSPINWPKKLSLLVFEKCQFKQKKSPKIVVVKLTLR